MARPMPPVPITDNDIGYFLVSPRICDVSAGTPKFWDGCRALRSPSAQSLRREGFGGERSTPYELPKVLGAERALQRVIVTSAASMSRTSSAVRATFPAPMCSPPGDEASSCQGSARSKVCASAAKPAPPAQVSRSMALAGEPCHWNSTPAHRREQSKNMRGALLFVAMLLAPSVRAEPDFNSKAACSLQRSRPCHERGCRGHRQRLAEDTPRPPSSFSPSLISFLTNNRALRGPPPAASDPFSRR
jgi:hypothetical protein